MDAEAVAPSLRILAISGSLRAASSNSAILRAATLAAPRGMQVVLFDGIGRLPFFSPDLDRELDDPALPEPVREMRAAIAATDALLISSPEYAHGVPGVLKNALDWLVGGREMVGRHVMVLQTSPASVHALASIVETLRTMSSRVVDSPAISRPRSAGALDERTLLSDPHVGIPLAEALDRLGRATIQG
jgi:chromate reductase, NAD(P)H dehydrogenase (quinone)